MKKLSNAFIAIVLCVTTVLCLSACRPQPASNNKHEYKEVVNWEDTGTLSFDNNNEVVFNNVEIDFRTICDSDDAIGLKLIVDEFNKEFNGKIKVNFAREGQGTFYNTLARQISQNSGAPDLAMFHNQNLTSMQYSHLFQPVDRIMDASKISVDLNDYFEGTTKNLTVGKHLYGLPIDAHTEIIIYRKDLLKKYGIEKPTTYYELMDAALEIQQGEQKKTPAFKGVSLSYQSFGVIQYAFFTSLYQNGFEICNSETYLPEWTTAENTAAIKSSVEIFRSFCYGSNAVANSGTEELTPEREFAQGLNAFSFAYPWRVKSLVNTLLDTNEDLTADDIGVLSLSGLLTLDNSTETGNDLFGISHCFAIPRTVKDINKKAAAVFFAKWFTEKSVEWTSYGHIPMNKALYNSDAYKNADYTVKYLNNYGKAESFRNFPSTPYYTAINDCLVQIIVACMTDKTADVDNTINTYYNQAISRINAQLEL